MCCFIDCPVNSPPPKVNQRSEVSAAPLWLSGISVGSGTSRFSGEPAMTASETSGPGGFTKLSCRGSVVRGVHFFSAEIKILLLESGREKKIEIKIILPGLGSDLWPLLFSMAFVSPFVLSSSFLLMLMFHCIYMTSVPPCALQLSVLNG